MSEQNQNTSGDGFDLIGAAHFEVQAGIALDDVRDPVDGFDGEALAALASSAAKFAHDVRALQVRGAARPVPPLEEATQRVADGIRAELRVMVESACEHANEAADAGPAAFSAAMPAALAAAEVVFDEAVSTGHWALRGHGLTDNCRQWGTDEDIDTVIARAVDHGLLLVSGAAYVAAMGVLKAAAASDDEDDDEPSGNRYEVTMEETTITRAVVYAANEDAAEAALVAALAPVLDTSPTVALVSFEVVERDCEVSA